ncbi:dihydrolipoamide acetyltransferase family protein [Novosphingobium panipatense]|uniref:Dihydrolipoamide acetyltransferase component of pyruvate dehydrogenase complex n=1 Tax=Novosphingobium panipatense TaxID=428991 RepID=A0ABY1QL83_9SPHN|nr:dihydrolipoamide acetyltransferase family protein [Novosphingobium panipatense]SMP72160.1 pyruvate dehydrogenase E2 component (dihydrolipoamide acetyltransferase) [Novosphingobium panipatense]
MAKLTPFTMPKWGIEMAEGTIAEWMVTENVPFERGAVLTLIETDKITNEVEAEKDGRFVRILAEPGSTYPVGALLAVLSDGGEASAAEIDAVIASFTPSESGFDPDGGDDAPSASAAPPEMPVAAAAPAAPEGLAISPAALAEAGRLGLDPAALQGSGRNGRVSVQDVHQAARPQAAPQLVGVYSATPDSPILSTPVARRLCALHGLDLAAVQGSGPRGKVRRDDVLALVSRNAVQPSPVPVASSGTLTASPSQRLESGNVNVTPMSAMRRTIARRLTEAKQQIPHFYVRRRVRADRLLALRASQGTDKPSVNDYIVRAAALALMEVPAVNVQVHGTDIHQYASADVSVAVATDKGLVTPIVFGADDLSVAEIGRVMKGLAQRARSGKLRPEEFTGGSFSISNLGGFGVEQFDAIINPPQGAILAVGTARPEPIDDDGAIRIVPVLHLSLSCDHRAIDGADGGRFMAALANLIEQPYLL